MTPTRLSGWVHGLAAFPGHFIPLGKNKRPIGKWSKYSWAKGPRGAEQALKWLAEGRAVGFVLAPPLWVLDCDDAATARWAESMLGNAGIEALRVKTKRGIHFYGLLPDDFPVERLKNHLCHPIDPEGVKRAFDFKFGPRSYVVAPGTVRAGDKVVYTPLADWPERLPVVDPRLFLPAGAFWHEPKAARLPKASLPRKASPEGNQSPAGAEPVVDHRPCVMYSRSHADALERAKAFVRKAGVSVEGKGGRRTLAFVAENLVGWLGLKPEEAVDLLTRGEGSWNARCRRSNGDPYPWTKAELLGYMKNAVGKGSELGRREAKRQAAEQAARDELRGLVSILKASLVAGLYPGLPVQRVHGLFRLLGLPNLTPTALGIELRKQRVRTVIATRKKITYVPGLAYRNLIESVLEHRKPGEVGCPVNPTQEAPLTTKRSTNPLHMPRELNGLEGGESFSADSCLESRTNIGFFPEILRGAGYQTAFPWAEEATGLVLAPTSPYLAKLRVLASFGLLGVMAPRPSGELRDKVCSMFWPNHRVPKTDLRMMRLDCRKAGLVADDGSLTEAGLLALGLDGADHCAIRVA